MSEIMFFFLKADQVGRSNCSGVMTLLQLLFGGERQLAGCDPSSTSARTAPEVCHWWRGGQTQGKLLASCSTDMNPWSWTSTKFRLLQAIRLTVQYLQ